MRRLKIALRMLPLLISAVFLGVVPVAAAEAYPNRTVRLIVPVPPGGAADVVPRILAEKLAAKWGQPVIVENRPGAALNLAAQSVAKAAPDGYTLLVTPPGPLTTSKALYRELGFDPAAFVPVTIIARVPVVLVAGPTVQVSALEELITLARTNPETLTYASPGVGSPPHLVAAMLQSKAGIRLLHVPYKGLMPALTDLLGGQIHVMFHDLGSTLAHVKDGRLKALGTGSESRIPELPELPAIAESIPGFVATTWFAVVAPPRTPPEVADKISRAIAEVLEMPDIKQRLAGFSATPVGSDPAATARFLESETGRWLQVIKASGIKPE